jgi:Domain found in Dishevelled, Egl-10, and Pleckstrin (DEP)
VHCEPDHLHQLAMRMRGQEGGVSIKDRTYHLRSYKKCFVGSRAVDWLVENTECSSREEAIALANEMLDAHLLHHVCHDHRFKDECLFYRFLADESNTALNSKYGMFVCACIYTAFFFSPCLSLSLSRTYIYIPHSTRTRTHTHTHTHLYSLIRTCTRPTRSLNSLAHTRIGTHIRTPHSINSLTRSFISKHTHTHTHTHTHPQSHQ